jgi:hypothetical protein
VPGGGAETVTFLDVTIGSELAKPQFPAAVTATPHGPPPSLPGGGGARVVIAVADAGSVGAAWDAVVHRDRLSLTVATRDCEP